MLKTLHIPALAGLVLLAGASPARADSPIQCAVPEAPTISITPVSQEIQYDFDHSSRELTQMRGAAVPMDTATGGLRADQPVISLKVVAGNADYTAVHQDCLWYHDVTVTITLRPHIYIAREYNQLGPCRDAIMAHELHHVDVDREMMNKYSYVIGDAVRNVVNQTGAVGPFPGDEVDTRKQDFVQKIQDAVVAVEAPLRAEMTQRQAQVDSPEEYKRVSGICYGVHP